MPEDYEVAAKSWPHLQELLFEDSWDPSIERFRSRFVFRGLDRETYELSTSLIRLKGVYGRLERHLLRNFRKYAPAAVVEKDSFWHWLTLGQHHGLPTRLMDWTYSPFAAMHFATADLSAMSEPAAVWAVHVGDALAQAPEPFQTEWQKLGTYGLDLDVLPRLVPTLDDFDAAPSPFAVFYEPPSIDDRIVNQYAIFSALSDPTLTMDAWLQSPHIRPHVRFRKVVIPAELKWEVRDKLDHSNVTERMLFPGLDGLCTYLKRYYSPKS